MISHGELMAFSRKYIIDDFSSDVIQQRWTDYKKKKAELGEAFESEYFGESKSSRKHRLSFLGNHFNPFTYICIFTTFTGPYLIFRYAFIGNGQRPIH